MELQKPNNYFELYIKVSRQSRLIGGFDINLYHSHISSCNLIFEMYFECYAIQSLEFKMTLSLLKQPKMTYLLMSVELFDDSEEIY